ncbi:MAG: hypothetical protein KKE91_03935 [Candidatus Omnitrophica bacterium]|nr:hypothetical protein [Candidatus Omnitrophota bacterium]
MSIIYDALKKVEATHPNPQASPKTDKKTSPKFKIYLLYLGIICVGFLIANVSFNLLFRRAPIPSSAPGQQSAKEVTPIIPEETKAATVISAIKKQPRAQEAQFVLSGVFLSDDTRYALINNRVVKEGDVIKEATVGRITADEVELQLGDAVIKLSL